MTAVKLPTTYGVALSVPASGFLLKNFCPVPTPEGRSEFFLLASAGITSVNADLSGNCRGLYVHKGVLYGVYSGNLYRFNSAYVGTILGSINGAAPVQFAADLTDILITNGGTGGVYETDTGVFYNITDVDFAGSLGCCQINNYFITIDKNRSKFNWQLNTGSLASWSALNTIAVSYGGDLIVGIQAYYNDLWLFCERHVEVWRNVPSTPFFERATILEVGCAAQGSLAQDDNSIFFLGDDYIVYKMTGYQNQAVSNVSLSYQIEQLARNSTVTDAIGYTYTHAGQKFYVLNFPTANKTFVHEITANSWHERTSPTLGRYRIDTAANIGGRVVGGSTSGAKLYDLSYDLATDDTEIVEREIYLSPIASEVRQLRHVRLEIVAETGLGGLTSADSMTPTIELSWSDDGGKTYGSELARIGGLAGQFGTRIVWHNLGLSDLHRVYKMQMNDKTLWRVIAADLVAG